MSIRNPVGGPFGASAYAGPIEPVPFDDDLRGRLAARLAAFPRLAEDRGDRRHAAVAVALLPGDDGAAAFVLTRRAPRLTSHAGQWALPGGSLDAGETPEDAGRRELREEVGLDVGAAEVLGLLDDYPTRSGYVITPVVVWSPAGDLAPDPREVQAVHRIPLTELLRPDSPQVVTIPESDRPVIQVPIGESVISAPTAAVLHQFAEVGLHGRTTRVAHFDQPVFAWE